MTNSYHVAFTKQALKELKKMDKHQASIILAWIKKNLEGCENPRLHGKALVANHTGKWRYRIGDYRLITHIDDDQIIILVLDIGHRRSIY
ncbi:type II toxin-antitoxin system RelE/ParE family toxin (plasmid) [Lysinibacillus macroides]|uniref:type II toxin-antitoxin system RelE family toxin n=1 Tax=Lysinibacillus macroides TaxID=33935 RepID=UPI001938A298|nr:type II toxin-antitoxin system RelE/ParE family toxin [Lysinibacillus macroides]